MPQTQKHKNRLFLVRNKHALGQKQIAVLLGHQTTDQISRYERGTKLPSLKTALKLGIIYHTPLDALFDGYYKACLDELKRCEKALKIKDENVQISLQQLSETEFCTIEEKLKSIAVKDADLDRARSHISDLLRARMKRMNHI